MSDSFNTTVYNWQGIDEYPIGGSENLLKSYGVFDTERAISLLTQPYPYGYTEKEVTTDYAGTYTDGLYTNRGAYNSSITWLKTTDYIEIPSNAGNNIYISATFEEVSDAAFNNLNAFDSNNKFIFGTCITGRNVVKLIRGYKYRFTIVPNSLKLWVVPMSTDLKELEDVQERDRRLVSFLCQPNPFGYTINSSSADYSGTFTDGVYKTDGTWQAINFLKTTELIEIPSINTAYISVPFPDLTNAFNTLCVYDSDGNYVTGFNISGREVIKLLPGYKYKVTTISGEEDQIKLWVNPLRVTPDGIGLMKSLFAGIDGDSTTTEGESGNGQSWPYFSKQKLGYSYKNIAMGNATLCDRTSSTSGTSHSPQWKPTAQNWIDYWDIPELTEGTAEYDQAVANNCLYAHIGYFIDMVDNNIINEPNIFIFANAGVNDLWSNSTSETLALIGTFEDAIAGDWNNISRNTVLKSIRWGIQMIRSKYKNCKIFFKTSVQQASRTHAGYYQLEEPLLKLLRYLSVPVIDSYAELGVQQEFEEGTSAPPNQWTSDGTHPTSAGYQKDGLFVANKLKTYFSYI